MERFPCELSVKNSAFGAGACRGVMLIWICVDLPYEKTSMGAAIYTIGHSTHTIAEFIKILQAHGIDTVADVRTIAKSRHNPQFNEPELRESLAEHGIGYLRLEGLGGLRHTTNASINTAWENRSFRGYADYMQTAKFAESLARLMQTASEKRTVIMCAEAVPWRCHRSLIGDALLVHGVAVEDIMSEKTSKAHVLTPWAKVEQNSITYPKT